MKGASLAALTVIALAACNDPTGSAAGMHLQVQGQVTSAPDGAPLAGATVQLRHWDGVCVSAPCPTRTDAAVITDAGGHYALATETDRFCSEAYHMLITAPGYAAWWSTDHADIQCTEQLQAIDARLEPAGG